MRSISPIHTPETRHHLTSMVHEMTVVGRRIIRTRTGDAVMVSLCEGGVDLSTGNGLPAHRGTSQGTGSALSICACRIAALSGVEL